MSMPPPRTLGHDHHEKLGHAERGQISNARLKIGDELGGHIVAGMPDGIATIVKP